MIERALLPGRLPTVLSQYVTHDVLTERIFLGAYRNVPHDNVVFFLIGARGPRVFSFLNGNPSLLLKVSFSVSTSSLVKSKPCFKS